MNYLGINRAVSKIAAILKSVTILIIFIIEINGKFIEIHCFVVSFGNFFIAMNQKNPKSS